MMTLNVPIFLSYGAGPGSTNECDIYVIEDGKSIFATLFVFAYVLPLTVIAILSLLIGRHIASQRAACIMLRGRALAASRRRRGTGDGEETDTVPGRRHYEQTRALSLNGFGSFRSDRGIGGGQEGVRLRERVSVDVGGVRRGGGRRGKRHASRLLVLVVVLFATLWLPVHVYLLVSFFVFDGQPPHDSDLCSTVAVRV